jgi:hypothetical protein
MFFFQSAAISCQLMLMFLVSIFAIDSANAGNDEEGFIRGSVRQVIHGLDGKQEERQLEFVLACDQDCCLTGTNLSRPDQPTFKPIEWFLLVNKGNEFGIQITVDRRQGDVLSIDGKWSAKFLQELRNLSLVDSFESRYQVVDYGLNDLVALPVYLSWKQVGVTRDIMLAARRGTNYRGTNELGSLEILGAEGISTIAIKKSPNDLIMPGSVRLAEPSDENFPKGFQSIEEEYSFSPERKLGRCEPFRCSGTKVETAPDGRSRKTETEIQVTEHADARPARKFIDAFLAKLPNNKRIVTEAGVDVATVLDQGKQKIAVDRDVERMTETRFSNNGPSFYYYGGILVLMAILGLVGYLRWARTAS